MTEGSTTVLCLGFSRIVQRRVLPALERIAAVGGIEIGSRRGAPERRLLTSKVETCYDDFHRALEASPADVVYVSTVNSEHAQLTEEALRSGRHVVVDKPSFTRFEEAERLTTLAASRQLCLAEATVYTAHPQIALCRQVFAEAGCEPQRISAIFSMPPLAPENFRYRAEFGGGALWDLGPYAVSLGRVFFASKPIDVRCQVVSRNGTDGVDTAFSCLVSYPRGRTMVGHFGFDTEYCNEVTLLGPGASVQLSRIFSTPPEVTGELRIRIRNEERQLSAPSSDSFTLFLGDVLRRIREGDDVAELGRNLRYDASVLDALRRAAKEV